MERWQNRNLKKVQDGQAFFIRGGKATTIFDHLAYARLTWSCGQKFLTMTMAKISRITMVKWSKFRPLQQPKSKFPMVNMVNLKFNNEI